MKKRIISTLVLVSLCTGLMAGCAQSETRKADNVTKNEQEVAGQEETQLKDSVKTESEADKDAMNDTQEKEEPVQETGQSTEADKDTTAEAENETEAEAASELKGTVDEIKDFMFVVTDDTGVSYAFSFDDKPKGLDEVAVGDNVTVKYTGTISEIDPFMGEVISVDK